MKGDSTSAGRAGRRLDQWLWFARFLKSRSLAARLCAKGAVVVNQVTVKKAHHVVRIGDIITVRQGAVCRTVRLLTLGARRGPAAEARLLYEEIASPARHSECDPVWQPLLVGEGEMQNEPL